MNGDFDPENYASEADYTAGRKRAERRIDRPEDHRRAEERANERGKAGADDSERDNERGSLRPVSVEQMLMRPIPSWLVRGVLPERSFGRIFGAPGSGKSFIMLDMAAAVARGVPWLGRRVHRSGVIYVAGEGHLTLRLRAYLEHYAIATTELARMRAVPANINLMHPETDLEALVSEIRKAASSMGGVALVVLDTLNAMMPGGDENPRTIWDTWCGRSAPDGRDRLRGGLRPPFRKRRDQRIARAFKPEGSRRLRDEGLGDGTERVEETLEDRDGEPGHRFGSGCNRSTSARIRTPRPTPASGSRPARLCQPPDHDDDEAVRRDVALDALREILVDPARRS